jgi:hypothetical protein
LNQVNFIESLVVTGPLDIKDGNNVLVIKVSQQLHLAQCAQTEHGVVEWRDLLDGNLLARGLVNGRATCCQRSLAQATRTTYQTTP